MARCVEGKVQWNVEAKPTMPTIWLVKEGVRLT
jgi:hypothetical protein